MVSLLENLKYESASTYSQQGDDGVVSKLSEISLTALYSWSRSHLDPHLSPGTEGEVPERAGQQRHHHQRGQRPGHRQPPAGRQRARLLGLD